MVRLITERKYIHIYVYSIYEIYMIHTDTFMEKIISIWEDTVFSLPNICNSDLTFVNKPVPRIETVYVNVHENLVSTLRKYIEMYF